MTAPILSHGEGPFWDSRAQRLLCVDCLASTVVSIDAAGAIERYVVPGRAVSVIRHRTPSGFIIATDNSVIASDEAFANFELLARLSDDPEMRMNDGGCDPLGGFVVGSMRYDGQLGRSAVYRLSPDGEVRPILARVSISNGIQWSRDNSRVFYVDSPSRRVDVFDVESNGAWSNQRTHIRLDQTIGVPDGMAIDKADGLWIAFWGGGVVNHYDALGHLVETVVVPGVTQVSSCAFGGDDLATLYITTSRMNLLPHQEPWAGAIFAVATSTSGALQAPFTG